MANQNQDGRVRFSRVMKVLVPIVIGLLVVGCATPLTPEEQKFVGTYEREKFFLFLPSKLDLKDNGRVDGYGYHLRIFRILPKRKIKVKWKIEDGKMHHIKFDEFGIKYYVQIFRINSDGSLTAEPQNKTYKRIK